MKIGNVSQTVIRRSILKQIHKRREESVLSPSVEEMCAGIEVEEGYQVVFSNSSIYGDEKDLAVFAMAQAVNDIETRGADTIGVGITILLPPYAYESRLKAMISYAEEAAKEQNLEILNAKTEINPVISKTIVMVTAIGTVKKGELIQSNMANPDQDIVITGYIGVEGMLRIIREKEEELSKRFVPAFINQIKNFDKTLFSLKELSIAKEHHVSAMHQITDGGVMAALWNVAESSGTGLEVRMKDIPIKQETIEVCEYFHLNPYQMTSAGSILMITDHGNELAEKLQKEGIPAVVVGKTTDTNERILWSHSEKRYLDRPSQDELVKIYS